MEVKLFSAINIVRKQSPHIFAVLDLCEIKCNDEKVPTAYAAWNKNKKIFDIVIGKEFSEKLDAENLAALLGHELHHVLFNHCTETYFDENRVAGNIAMDAIINDCVPLLKDRKHGPLLNGGVFMDRLNKQFKCNFNAQQHTSREIYDFLLKQIPPESQQKFYGEGNFDDHKKQEEGKNGDQKDKDGNGGSEISVIDQQIIKEKLGNIIKENLESFKKAGSVSADIDRMVEEAIKPDYNFLALFERMIQKSLKSGKKSTWKKTSRRYGGDFKGHQKDAIPSVLFLVDTSGSMDEETLAKIQGQIDIINKKYKLDVCWGDTDLKGSETMKKGSKHKIPFRGGGGTDLNFYKKMINKKHYDLIIFDTDGYIGGIDDTDKIRKIFCIYGGGIEVPGYPNIIIK